MIAASVAFAHILMAWLQPLLTISITHARRKGEPVRSPAAAGSPVRARPAVKRHPCRHRGRPSFGPDRPARTVVTQEAELVASGNSCAWLERSRAAPSLQAKSARATKPAKHDIADDIQVARVAE